MKEAAHGPELGGDGVDECGDVVLSLLLDLGHLFRCGRYGALSNFARDLVWDNAEFRPAVERRQLDVQPPRELGLLGPDLGHRRPAVAWDQVLSSGWSHGGTCRPFGSAGSRASPAILMVGTASGALVSGRE